MKKYLMTLGLMLGILSLTGCQKDNTDSSVNIESEKMITRTFTVAGEWCEDTRSYYEEGEGVKISGTEILSVYWGDAQYAANDNTANSKLNRIKGSPSKTTAFEYTFSHNPVEGASAYDYYFIMPNTTTNNQQSKGHRPMVYLNTIQTPAANSFDPAQDYLVGKPLLNQSEVNSNASVYFKRMFAPLRMTVKNGGLLQEGEKILYATISQSATCSAKTALVGSAYFRFSSGNDAADKSDAYADARIRNFLATGYGNKVTAFYPTGLETDADGNYPVWYIVNPSNVDNDEPTTISGEMTITLVTDKRMVQRTVTLSNPMELAANALNKFSITFGDNATSISGEAVTTAFANVASLDELDTWSFSSNCSYANSSLEIANGSEGKVTLPSVSGKKISKIIVLPSLYHPNNSNVNTLDLYAGETQVGSYNFNAQNMLTSAENMYGYLVIDVPTEYQTSELSLVKPSTDGAKSSIRAITLIYESSTAPAATVELLSADKTTLSFNVELANATKYYYLCQPAADTAPSVEEVVNNGTESTATELTIENLSEATEYVLYVVPVGENDAQGALVTAEGKTKSSVSDFYSRWESGEDIVIGDLTVNNTNYPNAVKVNISELKNKDFTDGGLIFIEGEGSYTMTASPALVNDCIVIGNDPKYQPSIIMHYVNNSGDIKANYFALRAKKNFVFKNLKLDGDSNNYLFANTDATNASGEGNLYIEDCTISTNGNVISDSNTTLTLASVYINNCVIDFSTSSTGKAIYGFATKLPNKGASTLLKVTVTNNVVYSSTTLTNYLVMIGGNKTTTADFTAYATVNAEVVVNQNTTYGLFHTNGLVSVYSAKSVTALNNLHYFDNKTSLNTSYDVGYYKSGDTTVECKVRNNAAYTNNEGTQYWKPVNNSSYANTSAGDNLYKLTDEPFSSVDLTTGYLPVDASVVTNGAGATYETKLWYNWGE